jgi:hypothetical protein
MNKLWVDLEGDLLAVPDTISHEEWANQQGHDLEALLARGLSGPSVTQLHGMTPVAHANRLAAAVPCGSSASPLVPHKLSQRVEGG